MKIALIQISSVLDPLKNIKKIDELIRNAKSECNDLEAVFLPEVFYSMSRGEVATPYLIEEGNEHFQNIQKIAITHGVYVLGGSAATKYKSKVVNRSYNFSPKGELLESYDKVHLFSVNLGESAGETVLDERTVYTKGSELKTLEIGPFKLGLSICFDLRFPEMFREYFSQGANVFSISSAFTVPTGKAHWETLLRARAIENQSYVIACGQWGKHNEKIETYGHSMVIDPWGEVIADCGEGEGFAVCNLSMERINEIRGRMDVSPR